MAGIEPKTLFRLFGLDVESRDVQPNKRIIRLKSEKRLDKFLKDLIHLLHIFWGCDPSLPELLGHISWGLRRKFVRKILRKGDFSPDILQHQLIVHGHLEYCLIHKIENIRSHVLDYTQDTVHAQLQILLKMLAPHEDEGDEEYKAEDHSDQNDDEYDEDEDNADDDEDEITGLQTHPVTPEHREMIKLRSDYQDEAHILYRLEQTIKEHNKQLKTYHTKSHCEDALLVSLYCVCRNRLQRIFKGFKIHENELVKGDIEFAKERYLV